MINMVLQTPMDIDHYQLKLQEQRRWKTPKTAVAKQASKNRKTLVSREMKMKRACEACTKSKVKCVKREGRDKCQLCTKRGCPCIYKPRRNRFLRRAEKVKRRKPNKRIRKSVLHNENESNIHFFMEQQRCASYGQQSITFQRDNFAPAQTMSCQSRAEYDFSYLAKVLLDTDQNHTKTPITLSIPPEDNWEITFNDDPVPKPFPLDQLLAEMNNNLTVHC